jgi:hypothetical protein
MRRRRTHSQLMIPVQRWTHRAALRSSRLDMPGLQINSSPPCIGPIRAAVVPVPDQDERFREYALRVRVRVLSVA